MPDSLLSLLATIERLDNAATAPPWLAGRTQDPMVGNFYFDRHCVDGSSPIEGHGGPGEFGTAIGVTHSPDDAQIVAFSRNTLAPLASMLRVAVEALEEITTPEPDGSVKCLVPLVCEGIDGEARCLACIARAALATIRRMAEEVERG